MPASEPTDDLIPAIGYIRVSMAREEMISPEIQRSVILQWAARTGHRIVDWVEDLDKTGRNFKRKIMRVIERVESGEVRAIGVWKYSRFGRTRASLHANLARVEATGGQLLSATEEVDARTAIGRFQRDVIIAFNAFESDRSGEQWMETHQWRRDQGLPATGGHRFGYIWHPRKIYAPDGTITLQEERYEPDSGTKDIVLDVYRRYAAGTGFNTLAILLNDAGIPNARKSLWNDRSLSHYMDSGFAAGFLRVHNSDCKTVPYLSRCPNHHYYRHPAKGHTAIIGAELWQQYLDRREFTRLAAPKNRAAAYGLSGLLRCGVCDTAVRRVVRHGYAHLYCNSRARKGTAACKGFGSCPVPLAESEVLAWLQELADDVNSEAKTLTAVRSIPDPVQSFEQRREAAEREVQRFERAIAKHMRVYAMSERDDPDGTLEREYLATLAAMRAEKATAVEARAALDTPSPEEREAMGRAAARTVAIGLLEEWDTLTPGHINALLRRVVGHVDIFPGRRLEIAPAWAQE